MIILGLRLPSPAVALCALVGCVIPINQTSPTGGDSGVTTEGGVVSEGGVKSNDGPQQGSCFEAGTCGGPWVNVTPADMPAAALVPSPSAYGPGAVVADPARPTDMYIGAAVGLWKSSDYGNTWTQINNSLPDPPMGVTIAVAGTTPATIWAADRDGSIYKSTDGGTTFTHTGVTLPASLYSLQVDPNDPTHLLSGLHEKDGIVESTDGGTTWSTVGGDGFPSGAISWFPYFIKTGDAATTSQTWLAIPQNGANLVVTTDKGAHWTIPNVTGTVQHPVGSAQIYQTGSTIFVGSGNSVYRSTDLGTNWSPVGGSLAEAIVWGTSKNVYAMWGFACSPCSGGANFEAAALPGDTWTDLSLPNDIPIGPVSIAVTNDGSHNVAVGVFWGYGIWRYVEP